MTVSTENKKKSHQNGRPLGAHLSIAGGVDKAISRAEAIEAEALQIFTRNQRQWESAPLTVEQEERFLKACRRSSIRFFCVHASYLCNLASDDSRLQEKSRRALLEELERGSRLGARCLVLHPGSAKDGEPRAARRRAAEGLACLLDKTAGMNIEIALENTAGQGAVIGSTLQDLKELLEILDFHPRLSVCLDTAHAFAAGVELRKSETVERWIDELERSKLLERVRLLHLNDSLYDCGSRKDRHTHIGKGYIGEAGFINLLKASRFHGIPGIIETPKGESDVPGCSWDELNLQRLREIE